MLQKTPPKTSVAEDTPEIPSQIDPRRDAALRAFWPPQDPEREATAPDPDLCYRLAATVSMVEFYHFPTEELVAALLAFRPDAASSIRRWQEIFNRSLSPVSLALSAHKQGVGVESRRKWIAPCFTDASYWAKRGDRAGAADCLRRADAIAATLTNAGHRDWRLHALQDVDAFVSLEDAKPGSVVFVREDREFLFSHHDSDGLPVLAEIGTLSDLDLGGRDWMNTVRDAAFPGDPEDWSMAPFRALCGRPMAMTQSLNETAYVLLAMAHQGETKAFLKGRAAKSGTWVIHLNAHDTARDLLTRIVATAPAGFAFGMNGILVQQYLPFHAEQRFFIVGGRVIASAASDRRDCWIDRPSDRRLDDRVAVPAVAPMGDHIYDRGTSPSHQDRVLSAKMARFARRFAEQMRSTYEHDYVLDVGLSDAGIAAVEMNRFYYAGPYGLSRRHVYRARARLRDSLRPQVGRIVEAHLIRAGARRAAAKSGVCLALSTSPFPWQEAELVSGLPSALRSDVKSDGNPVNLGPDIPEHIVSAWQSLCEDLQPLTTVSMTARSGLNVDLTLLALADNGNRHLLLGLAYLKYNGAVETIPFTPSLFSHQDETAASLAVSWRGLPETERESCLLVDAHGVRIERRGTTGTITVRSASGGESNYVIPDLDGRSLESTWSASNGRVSFERSGALADWSLVAQQVYSVLFQDTDDTKADLVKRIHLTLVRDGEKATWTESNSSDAQ